MEAYLQEALAPEVRGCYSDRPVRLTRTEAEGNPTTVIVGRSRAKVNCGLGYNGCSDKTEERGSGVASAGPFVKTDGGVRFRRCTKGASRGLSF